MIHSLARPQLATLRSVRVLFTRIVQALSYNLHSIAAAHIHTKHLSRSPFPSRSLPPNYQPSRSSLRTTALSRAIRALPVAGINGRCRAVDDSVQNAGQCRERRLGSVKEKKTKSRVVVSRAYIQNLYPRPDPKQVKYCPRS